MITRRFALPTLVAAAAAVMLTGCAASTGLTDLDREATEADALPELPEYAYDDVEIDPDSTRYVGEHEGTQLWLTRTAANGACLLSYPDSEGWLVGCTDGGLPLTTSGPGGSFTVIADDATPPEGAVAISENVFALGS